MTDDLTAHIAEIASDHRFAHMMTIPGEGGVIDSYCVCMCQVACKGIATHVAELIAAAAEQHYRPTVERLELVRELHKGWGEPNPWQTDLADLLDELGSLIYREDEL